MVDVTVALPAVFTVILNTNRREDTLACLASFETCSYENHHVIVLDNASTDGSLEAIRTKYPWARTIELDNNLGYAGNNNVGIQAALDQGADWIYVLNEDTIVDSDCITRLVQAGETDARIGIVGPTVYHFDEPGVIQSAGGRLDKHWDSVHLGQNEKDTGQYDQPRQVDWISGCALLIRRQVVERIGMLDERFFYYWEETDWCLRAGENGWKILHVPPAKIWHKGVQRDYRPSPNVTYYATRNHLLLLQKHRAPFSVWLFTILQTLRTLVSWTIRPRWREMHGHRDAMWQGMLDYFGRRWGMRPVRLPQ